MKPRRTFLMLDVPLIGGPHDCRCASVVADDQRMPPPVLTMPDQSEYVYRYSFDKQAYVWYRDIAGTLANGGRPFKLSQ